jgi:uncharacterized protein (DUF2225 family)
MKSVESYAKKKARCPKCGFKGACEFVVGDKPISITKSAFGIATGGLSLLLTGITKSEPKKYLECPECHHVFKA